ncbi:MAG: PKD domain-containing protein [Candidatus Saccharibacteria bacterium]|nr:PKD domain-containing protein [Candidatus Saccharibacteria bacterium]
MFKKIVSNLPFSPALVGQLGFYAKRLKKEEATRRLGLIFLALTLIVQSFAIFQPSESANASSDTDMVSGGVSSISDYLKSYDANTKHLQDTMNYVGITRHEIVSAASNYTSFKAGDKLSWGYASRFSYAEGERVHPIFNDNGTRVSTVYSRPLRLWGNSSMLSDGWIGHSAKMGWFAILRSCGNLVTDKLPTPVQPDYSCDELTAKLISGNQYKFSGRATAKNGASVKNYEFDFGDGANKTTASPNNILHTYSSKDATYKARLSVNFKVNGASKNASSNACTAKITVSKPPTPPPCTLNPDLLASDENCKPCPGNDALWINDESCIPNIIQSKTATNTSQGFVDASSVTAHSGDQISYTINIENKGLSTKTVKLEDHLGDVLEYSTLVDKGGGSFNETTKVLSWSDVTLAPKEKQTRTFVVRVMDEIPATATGASDPTSFDCIMTNIFGNSTNVNVDCPTPKIVETVAKELPHTGPTENIIFSGIILAITTYFYVRTRQVKREVQLIRKDVTTGTI